MRVAIYLRVSSEEQTKGHSLDTQRDALTEWANRENWNIVETYEDAGVSATSAAKRPAFMEMIHAAKEGQFEMVLVKRRDRFARNMGDAGAYEQTLLSCGVRVWSHDEPATNEDTPAGFLMKGMLDVFAAHYSVELSRKTADGWRKRAEKGLPIGDIPFGYRSVGAQEPPEVVLAEAEAVVQVFTRYASGQASMVELAQYLDDLGLRPRSKRGLTRFTKDSVGGMLSNRFYVGEIAYKDEFVVRGRHEPIVGVDLWEAAARARGRRAAQRGATPARQHPYLLRGIGVCSSCEAVLWGNRSRDHHYYRCAGQRRGTACPNGSRGVRADLLEEKVAALFSDIEIPSRWQAIVRRILDEEGPDRGALESERERLKRRRARIQEALFGGLVDMTTARAELQPLQTRLDEIDSALAAEPNPSSLADDFINVRRLWPLMSEDERQGVVQAALEAVEVDLADQRVVAFKPRPEMEPLFGALESAGSNENGVCAWRPRADSNRRSPP